MKKILFICSVLIVSSLTHAQSINIPETLELSESKMMLDNVERNGFRVAVAGPRKDVEKSLVKFLKEEHDYEVKTKSKSVIGEDILSSSFSDKHFNLKAVVKEVGGDSELQYFISFGTDIYVNSNDYPAEATKCKALLTNFVKQFYSSFINKDIEENTKELAKSTKDLGKVQSTISGLEKSKAKEIKKKEKLEKSKVKLDEKLRKLNENIEANAKEIKSQDLNVSKLEEEMTTEKESEAGIQAKVDEQKKTLSELKSKLAKVQKF